MVLITQNATRLRAGSPIPEFAVTDLAGRPWNAAALRTRGPAGAVVGFTCNHCPYVQAYEDRLIALAKEFMPRGFAFLMINPNAANPAYPDDSLDQMKARAALKGFPFFYAVDATQDAARAFGAACTPEFFAFGPQGTLVYTGRIDDEMEPSKATHAWLRDALDAVAAGRAVPTEASHPIGCSIKWL